MTATRFQKRPTLLRIDYHISIFLLTIYRTPGQKLSAFQQENVVQIRCPNWLCSPDLNEQLTGKKK